MTPMEELTIEEQKALKNEGDFDEAYDYGDEYAFGSEDTTFTIPTISHNIHSHTNQGMNNETKQACTIVGALNQIIRLFGIDLDTKKSNELAIEVVKFATKYGYIIGHGWSTPTAINVVVKRWNTVGKDRFGKEPVVYFRLDYANPLCKEALEKGHYLGFTYALNYGNDRYRGLVDKDSYPGGIGHRTNRKHPSITKPTGWATCNQCDVGVHDSYYSRTNEYLIKDRKKYMGKGMYPPAYLILPQSSMGKSVEEIKQDKTQEKAINTLIGVLSSTREYLDEDHKKMMSELALSLRQKYPEARKKIEMKESKVAQTIADTLSFGRKDLEKFRDDFAKLAKAIRDEYKVQ